MVDETHLPDDVFMVQYEILDPFGAQIGRGICPMNYAQLNVYGMRDGALRVPFLLGRNGALQHYIQFHL